MVRPCLHRTFTFFSYPIIVNFGYHIDRIRVRHSSRTIVDSSMYLLMVAMMTRISSNNTMIGRVAITTWPSLYLSHIQTAERLK